MTQNKTPYSFELKIQSLAFGGFGIGHHESKVVFVANTFPGDEVLVSLQEEKKNFSFASVEKLLKPSPHRVKPSCPFVEKCGGCQWLGMAYKQQVIAKQGFLLEAFKRLAKITLPTDLVLENHASAPTHYRNRVLLRGQIHENGKITVGFLERSTHRQVAITACQNVDPLINIFIEDLSKLKLTCTPQKLRLEVQVLPAHQDQQKAPLLVLIEPLHGPQILAELKQVLTLNPLVTWVGFYHEIKDSSYFEFESDLGLRFYTAPSVFQQVNIAMNHKVRRLIQSYVSSKSINSVLDLFCGSGNLSLALADSQRSILGVEQTKLSIELASYAVKANKLSLVEYLCMPAEKFLKKAIQDSSNFDLIIADPPRKGMKDCMELVKALSASYIIYMSCDPITLARDLKELVDTHTIEQVHTFDFFPNTYHVESLVFLAKKNGRSS